MPMRVLDSDGVGNVLVIAQAVRNSVAAGAGVINLSLGAPDGTPSAVLNSALEYAENAGVLVVSPRVTADRSGRCIQPTAGT